MCSIFVSAKGFVQCKKSDPALNECIKVSLQSSIPHLIKGTYSFESWKTIYNVHSYKYYIIFT